MDREYARKMALVEDHHWWFVARRQILGDMLGRLAVPPNARLLEAGCGTGGNLKMLAAFGTVDAFEPHAQPLSHARSRVADVMGYTGILESGALPDDIPFEGVSYDVILLLDVLEHVEKDADALVALRKRLKVDGRLIVTVPAYRWLWSDHDERNEHRRRYTRKGLQELLTSTDFRVSTLTHFNMWLLPFIAGIRMARKITRQQGDDLLVPRSAMNALLGGVMASERFLMRRTTIPFGVSILAVAEVATHRGTSTGDDGPVSHTSHDTVESRSSGTQ